MNHFDEARVIALAKVLEAFPARCVEVALTTQFRSEFEHVQEARTAFLMLRGHGSALRALSALGPGAYPSGWPVARSMFEVGVRSAWRMDVDDPYEAEGRWATWLARSIEYERLRSVALEAQGLNEWAQRVKDRAEGADSFRHAFQALLREKGVAPMDAREPAMRKVLAALGQPDYRYQTYADASEQLHGSFVASEAYSRGLGTKRVLAEYAEWTDWVPPLAAAMQGVQALGQVFADRLSSERMKEVVAAAEDDWESALRD